jgi:hypothetical protein
MGVFLKSKENGLLPGRVPGLGGYLGREVLVTVGHVGSIGRKTYTGTVIQCEALIATLLIIGGVELNPVPVDNIVQVSYSGCNRTLKSGTQSDTCGWWYHNSCGNVNL